MGTESGLGSQPLRVLSLFSGIGGLDLGLQRAGMEIVAHSEFNTDPKTRISGEHNLKVLAARFPNIPNLGDVSQITEFPQAEVIAGGFPCQDISAAGKRAGITGARSGLWRFMARSVRMVRPKYVIVENVAALLHRGMDVVLGDLAEEGYDAEWDCIPAGTFGAPHARERVFVVAHNAIELGESRDSVEQGRSDGPRREGLAQPGGRARVMVDRARPEPSPWDVGIAELRGMDDGLSRWMDGRLEHLPAPLVKAHKTRNPRLYGLGNAVVPQVGEHIGRMIVDREGVA